MESKQTFKKKIYLGGELKTESSRMVMSQSFVLYSGLYFTLGYEFQSQGDDFMVINIQANSNDQQ